MKKAIIIGATSGIGKGLANAIRQIFDESIKWNQIAIERLYIDRNKVKNE